MKSVLTHRQVINLSATWLSNLPMRSPMRSMIILREPTTYISTYGNELPDVIGITDGSSSVNIEVKVSRSDFFADKKKRHTHPFGHHKIYACPTGLINPEEIPEKWGLLYVNGRGGKLVKRPEMFNDEEVNSVAPLILNILLNAVMDGAVTSEHLRRPKNNRQWDGKGRIL